MAGLPLFICDILAFCLKSRDNKGKAEVMTVLTFQAVLAIFGDYLSKDLEEDPPRRRRLCSAPWREKSLLWMGRPEGRLFYLLPGMKNKRNTPDNYLPFHQ